MKRGVRAAGITTSTSCPETKNRGTLLITTSFSSLAALTDTVVRVSLSALHSRSQGGGPCSRL
jgi:hypothetical protein